MCLLHESRIHRVRRLTSIGLFCLVVALASQSLSLTFGLSLNPLHFLRGVLIGISLAANLHAIRLASQQRRSSQL